ncbi:MAG: hypothetical protein ACC645_17075 [Pirellulales bacterium]
MIGGSGTADVLTGSIDGGADTDTLDYSAYTTTVTVTTASASFVGGSLSNIETFVAPPPPPAPPLSALTSTVEASGPKLEPTDGTRETSIAWAADTESFEVLGSRIVGLLFDGRDNRFDFIQGQGRDWTTPLRNRRGLDNWLVAGGLALGAGSYVQDDFFGVWGFGNLYVNRVTATFDALHLAGREHTGDDAREKLLGSSGGRDWYFAELERRGRDDEQQSHSGGSRRRLGVTREVCETIDRAIEDAEWRP